MHEQALREISLASLSLQTLDPVSNVAFSTREELLWSGTSTGRIHVQAVPSLQQYSTVQAHKHAISSMVALGPNLLTVSSAAVRLHASSGLPCWTYSDLPAAPGACSPDVQSSGRALVGLQNGSILTLDISTGQCSSQADTGCSGITRMQAPTGHGLVALGTSSGQVALADPQSGMKATSPLTAHAGGLLALDCREDLLVTCGMGMRLGQAVADSYVKVFDVRVLPRMLGSYPFTGGTPALLRFHPKFSSTLLVASAKGAFTLADVNGPAFHPSYQVSTEGDLLTCIAISTSGEAIAFGGSGGYVHLWSMQDHPRVNLSSSRLVMPAFNPPVATPLREEDSFANAATYPSQEGSLLSEAPEWDAAVRNWMKCPPRIIHASLQASMKQRDFVGHNRTRFVGLENDIANCYANSLLQVLYFIPAMRQALLTTIPDANTEFSLVDELALLVRMLSTARGGAVAASNVLRALRQSRQAAALGLLEGHAQASHGNTDIEVEANKDRNLRTQCLGGDRALATRDVRTFQVDLQYPPAKERPTSQPSPKPKSKQPKAAPAAQLQPGYPLPAFAPGASRPQFAELLTASLHQRNETRAWFDEAHGYQYVQQSRLPVGLPQVLAVSCGMFDRQDVVWWQPWQDTASAEEQQERPWLPFAIQVRASPGEEGAVSIWEGDDAAELEQRAADASATDPAMWATYELTALVAHIQAEDSDASDALAAEGHLVAHIKVLPAYASSAHGVAASPLASESPGQSPMQPFIATRAPSNPLMGRRRSFSATPTSRRPSQDVVEAAIDQLSADAQPNTQEATAESGLPQLPETLSDEQSTPRSQLSSASSLDSATAAGLATDDPGESRGLEETSEGNAAGAEQQAEASEMGRLPSFPATFKRLTLSAERTSSSQHLAPSSATRPSSAHTASQTAGAQWVLFNDICILAEDAKDVRQLHGSSVVPCLLYYTQVNTLQGLAARRPASPPAPVLTPQQFQRLSNAAPLQGLKAGMEKPTFQPLAGHEMPVRGMLLALDAEFVALSMPSKTQGGLHARPARLALGRVSVVRGAGPQAGLPLLDDYIRASEPVADHLTKYSGIKEGDLDPALSRKRLVTAKAAYLKLRYLVDCGCVFIGHGLKKDFRMINIIVPPEQVLDTVELFHFKRQRKLSLRFLAAYLLQSDIQSATHDSIEDARTALLLYKEYEKHVTAGTLRDKLLEIYRWGKQHGWDATALIKKP
ncbi:hypothetical protein WJX73_008700 [Symbiochloris irregularis]|uniref:Exonuclease domain-containing protein n=1 Tax=Symbiochloris irregularis TaxID=706552 RepID=A0AAW1NW31_9CHLO